MTWQSPFELPGSWFKGNLHTHTTQSDGAVTPEEAVSWYAQQGYDFLALSDHQVYTPGGAYATPDLLTIPGVELNGPGYHLLAIGTSELPDLAAQDDPQTCVDAVLACGGLPFFAHPYWCGQTPERIGPIQGVMGIEVYNSVCERMDGLGNSSLYWDALLSEGKHLLGIAVDDTHWRYGEVGVGFVVVRAATLTVDNIIAALRAGHFYSSSGPRIQDLRVVRTAQGQPALRVCCSPCEHITFHGAASYGRRAYPSEGALLDTATCPFRPEQVYLRVECQDAQGRIAWTNPVFVKDVL